MNFLNNNAEHPALAGIYVGNEIPSQLVRFIGPAITLDVIEDLIDFCKEKAPQLLCAYANYPSTEFLEPANADFTAFNIYLENRDAFTKYLRRLHNIAGDRPLVVSEFGLDTLRNGCTAQSDAFSWAIAAAFDTHCAGFTAYAWTDLWQNGGQEVIDWDFGLTTRSGRPKPALTSIAAKRLSASEPTHTYSVLVCTYNGAKHIAACLEALSNLSFPALEIIVVNDGSTDASARIVAENFPNVVLHTIPSSGLSHARNIAASLAKGEILAYTDDDCIADPDWLKNLDSAYQDPAIAAAGGPNLPPSPENAHQAIVISTPGAPSHILLNDTEAEHIPGCNLTVRASVFHEIGGFDPQFHTAGDDVDFCWRLSAAGHAIAFVPGAFVWHFRRSSIRAFFRQQSGYGKAEKLLQEKFPEKFAADGQARWQGHVYSGAPLRAQKGSVIYHGPQGFAPYQSISHHSLPLRPMSRQFNTTKNRFILCLSSYLQRAIRSWTRNRRIPFPCLVSERQDVADVFEDFQIYDKPAKDRTDYLEYLEENGWKPELSSISGFDLSKNQTRLLIGTEYFIDGSSNQLIRVWGSPDLLREDLDLTPL